MRKIGVVLVFVCALFISGCATNRGYLGLRVPNQDLINKNGKQVFIRTVTDNRQFQDKPATPDIPSLGFSENVAQTPKNIKSRAIARKRNGFGKAMGDILLEEDQSVEKIVFELIKNSLYTLGYEVTDKQEEAKQDSIVLDVSIDKYWAYLAPGLWTLSLKSEIGTTIYIKIPQRDEPIVIYASAVNYCQKADTANWQKVFDLVIKDYMEKVKGKFGDLKF